MLKTELAVLVDYSNITLTIRQKGLKGQFSEGEGRFL